MVKFQVQLEESFVPIICLLLRARTTIDLGLSWRRRHVRNHLTPLVVARVKRFFADQQEDKGKILEFEGLTIDIPRHEVLVEGVVTPLTPKEFDLLVFLAEKPGWTYTREQILSQVWGYDFVGDGRTVDAHIKRLRQKLAVRENKGWNITTVWGVGYKFEQQREARGGVKKA